MFMNVWSDKDTVKPGLSVRPEIAVKRLEQHGSARKCGIIARGDRFVEWLAPNQRHIESRFLEVDAPEL